jgi:hypothetical protein
VIGKLRHVVAHRSYVCRDSCPVQASTTMSKTTLHYSDAALTAYYGQPTGGVATGVAHPQTQIAGCP